MATGTLSCGNVLSSGQVPTSDSALLFSFQMNLATGKWTAAIDDFAKMSSEQQNTRINQYYLASAYLGRCGMNTVSAADLISNGTSGRPLARLMGLFGNKAAATLTTSLADCDQAQSILTTLGSNGTNRTADENVLMILTQLSKITIITARRGDQSPVDGILDSTFNPCQASQGGLTSGTATSDQETLVYAIAIVKQSFDALPSTISFVSSFKSTFNTSCAAVNLASGQDVCAAVPPASVTAAMRRAIRALLYEGASIGFDRPAPAATGSNIAVTWATCDGS